MQKSDKIKKTFCRPLTNNNAYRFLKFELTYATKVEKFSKIKITTYEKMRTTYEYYRI